ncbi:hypothetical protein D3C76_1575260 [compost metagenome]
MTQIAGLEAFTKSRKSMNKVPAEECSSAFCILFFTRPERLAPVHGIPAVRTSNCGISPANVRSRMSVLIAIDSSVQSSGLLRSEASR